MKKYIKILFVISAMMGCSVDLTAKTIIRHFSAVKDKKRTRKRNSACASNLNRLNPLVFQLSDQPCGSVRPIGKACKCIEKGHYLHNDNSHTIINDKIYNLSCQMPADHKGLICIFVSGYSGKMSGSLYRYKGSGAYAVYRHIKQGFMPDALWISFDGPVSYLNTFNFGQELDQSCLHEIYTQTVQRNPEAKIILVGLCKGSTTILNYLNNPKYTNTFGPVKAVILESPLISFETLTKKIARTKVPKPLGKLLPGFFKMTFPNYVWNQPTIQDDASHFPKHIKAFIGCSHHDPVAPCQDAHIIMASLKKANVTVELFENCNKTTKHGHLTKVAQYKEKIDHFSKVAFA